MKFEIFKVNDENYYDKKKIGMWAVFYRCTLCRREVHHFNEDLMEACQRIPTIFEKPICQLCDEKLQGMKLAQ